MAAINVGKPSHHSLFDTTKTKAGQDTTRESQEAINRLKIRRARGVKEDDPIGFDSSTDPRYLAAPSN
jgi:hypothetical protein